MAQATQTSTSSHLPENYYNSSRADILELVPLEASTILELGCATGNLGAAIQTRQNARVTGVEYVEAVAIEARVKLAEVICADLDSFEFPWELNQFHCIIAADVLEHLKDPWAVLRNCNEVLRPGGTLIVSIPNMCHISIFEQLSLFRFDYADAGLLDRTHLRFFTHNTFREALSLTGYSRIQATPIFLQYPENLLREISTTGQLKVGAVNLDFTQPGAVNEFLTYQWLFTATKDAS